MSKKVKKLLTKTEAGDNIIKLSDRDSKTQSFNRKIEKINKKVVDKLEKI